MKSTSSSGFPSGSIWVSRSDIAPASRWLVRSLRALPLLYPEGCGATHSSGAERPRSYVGACVALWMTMRRVVETRDGIFERCHNRRRAVVLELGDGVLARRDRDRYRAGAERGLDVPRRVTDRVHPRWIDFLAEDPARPLDRATRELGTVRR